MGTAHDPKTMSFKDWVIVQNNNPAIREIEFLMGKNKMKGRKVNSNDPAILKQYPWQYCHLVLQKEVLYQGVRPSKEDRTVLQLVIL